MVSTFFVPLEFGVSMLQAKFWSGRTLAKSLRAEDGTTLPACETGRRAFPPRNMGQRARSALVASFRRAKMMGMQNRLSERVGTICPIHRDRNRCACGALFVFASSRTVNGQRTGFPDCLDYLTAVRLVHSVGEVFDDRIAPRLCF